MPTRSRKKDKATEFSLIRPARLLELYGWLLKCRMLEEHIGAPASLRDQEAAAVAVCLTLKRGDQVFAIGRECLPSLVRSGKVEAARAAWNAPATSPAATVQEALAAARKLQQAKTGNIAIVFCAGAAGRGAAWKKALSAAGTEKLPVIFVRILSSEAETSGHAEHGFPAIPADSHDVVAIYRVASESMAHARYGNGATLIECLPWTLAGEERGDALRNMEHYLGPRKIAFERTRAQVRTRFARKLAGSKAARAARRR